MNREDIFPSRWFKASNFPQPRDLKIVAAKVETPKLPHGESEEKLTLTFEGEKKKLVINRTNFDVIAEAFGDDTDNWLGETIQLYADKTRFGGKVVPCVRVRVPINV